MTEEAILNDESIVRTAEIVAAFVSNNLVSLADLPSVIRSVHASLVAVGKPVQETTEAPLTPAVPIKKSVTPDYIICLEDGKQFKSLKRHLATSFQMTPDAYRAKWGLPADYPMVAANYTATRSALAKRFGLGKKAAPVAEPAPRAKRARKPVRL